jgi:AcrR family transcriptional regulator
MSDPVSDAPVRRRMTGEERRRSIAATTVDLVASNGVRGATTARIAAAEGISERALYKHFANRREILLAAHDYVLERANRSLHERRQGNAIEFLRAAAQLHWPSEHEFVYPLFEFFASSPEEDLRGALKLRHQADVEFVKNIVEEGKTQGVVRPEVNCELAAWEFWAVCWAEDLSYMLGFDEFGSSGLASLMIERYLDSICVQQC